MTELLIRLLIKDYQNTQDRTVRQRYGILGGITGIVCNLILFLAKLFSGLMTASIAIIADAVNNLSDAGSCIVTVVGFKMAGKPADDEHPFGHGRIEYISGLFISMIIMLMGFELAKSSVEKIISPEKIIFGWLPFGILILSAAVKLWMGFFNKALGKKINSAAMKASAMDSLSDVASTLAVAAGMLLARFADLHIDGYIGLLVALFILYTGFMTAKDTLDPLLGQPPEKEFVESIYREVLSYDEVVGIHDLIVHNYGPGRCIVSLHAEVPCNADVLKIHDTIDLIEQDLRQKFHCEAVIHMDPIVTDDKETNETKQKMADLVTIIDPSLNIHDFRMVKGPSHTNLIFDIVVPHKFRLNDKELKEAVAKAAKTLDPCYETVIHIDRSYT